MWCWLLCSHTGTGVAKLRWNLNLIHPSPQFDLPTAPPVFQFMSFTPPFEARVSNPESNNPSTTTILDSVMTATPST